MTECTGCGKRIVRKRGTSAKGHLRWVDGKGRQWYGLRCPDCYRAYAKQRSDLELKLRTGIHGRRKIMTNRPCRNCGKPLPAARYFKCYLCQKDLPYEIT